MYKQKSHHVWLPGQEKKLKAAFGPRHCFYFHPENTRTQGESCQLIWAPGTQGPSKARVCNHACSFQSEGSLPARSVEKLGTGPQQEQFELMSWLLDSQLSRKPPRTGSVSVPRDARALMKTHFRLPEVSPGCCLFPVYTFTVCQSGATS